MKSSHFSSYLNASCFNDVWIFLLENKAKIKIFLAVQDMKTDLTHILVWCKSKWYFGKSNDYNCTF